MHFVIHCLDKPDALPRRMAAIDAHRTYLDQQESASILMSGPLMADDGKTMIGSLFVLEASDRAAVDKFNTDDPLRSADVWETISITAFFKRQG